MSIMKSILAIAAFALSAQVSAQVVFVPNFPVKEKVKAQTSTATPTKQIAQDASAPAKNAT
ncbi:hypothetical protein E0H82_07865 [Acinetobacter sp. ANC 4910]|uniref:hypothetical protein n=1 Tax=Acinetobacter sp. ANC 4910 TaxID=2529850 RepID=UPI00103909D9|nr:hypothetical protein [Acinetobacter sp. ANC 4910]TCB35882.1 hypothetical protein E0H82_07865 [Acinetobacter sp. ANC 4910]